MPDAWQSAWVEVLPDFSNFRREATPSITSILGGAGDEGGRTGSKRFGDSFIGGVGKLALPIAGAFAALGIGNMIGDAVRAGLDYVSEGVDLASDLGESVSAVERIYGSASEGIFDLGKNAAETFALTRTELNQFAVQFRNFSGTIAGDGGDVVGTFQSIAQRGVDFASVLNLEVDEAMRLFQSGLAGETEPLRQFGIDLSAANVNAYALANGIGSATGQLTEAEKIQARYGLLMQETNEYAGDFVATSGNLANQQRILNKSLTEVQTSAGEIFLPLMTQLANVANDQLVPALADVVATSGPELAAGLAESVPSLVSFLEALIPMLPTLLELGVEALPLVIKGAEALLPLILFLTENSLGWTVALNGIFGLLSGDTSVGEFSQSIVAAGGFLGWLVTITAGATRGFNTFGSVVTGAAAGLGASIASGVSQAVGFIQSLPQRAIDAVGNLGSLLYSSGRSLIQGFINGITSMVRSAGDAVAGVLDWVGGFFPNSPAERGPLSGTGWNELAKSGEAYMSQFTSGFGRPDLTGAIAPVLSPPRGVTSSPYAASASLGGPRELVIVDANHQLIGRMQVEADGRISANDASHNRVSRGRVQTI